MSHEAKTEVYDFELDDECIDLETGSLAKIIAVFDGDTGLYEILTDKQTSFKFWYELQPIIANTEHFPKKIDRDFTELTLLAAFLPDNLYQKLIDYAICLKQQSIHEIVFDKPTVIHCKTREEPQQ